MDNRAIGVFDSGLGGLSVLRELKKLLPNEDYIYFGDTKRLPYGSKDKETIKRYSKEIVDFFIEKDVKLIIIACNTITAQALDYLRETVDIPILGTVNAGARSSLEKTKNNKILLIATESTVESGLYEKKIKEEKKDAVVYSVACPKFVPLIENNMEGTKEVQDVIKEYLDYYKDRDIGIDTMILGCTHYPYIVEDIQKAFRDDIEFINPAVELSIEVKYFLEKNNMENLNKKIPTNIFYASGNIDKFRKDGSKHMGEKLKEVYKKEFD
ncbi:glutamate racemase [Miniphocaeibacter massiliensis]|uniref:glutamate racemase n=1 Tax=Miniphocaeibacter massiliensis TaxID=2041841 RepID=UPI0013EC1F82|nr:glutamate racemase [Miniphocaeibacter massiliensis]